MKEVSDKLFSSAIDCSNLSSSQESRGTTAAGLPLNTLLVKASIWYKVNSMLKKYFILSIVIEPNFHRYLINLIQSFRFILVFLLIFLSTYVGSIEIDNTLAAQNSNQSDNFFIGLKYWYSGQYERAKNSWIIDANNGDADAQYHLATLYETGTGVKKNINIAAKLYAEAAAREFPEAAIRLINLKNQGLTNTTSNNLALSYLIKAAKNGSAKAQYALGSTYERGYITIQNYPNAALWYEKAAKQGITEAQYNLAILLEYGLGVTKDSFEANKWYMKAASKGNTDAQNNIGYQYQYGLGLKRNLEKAIYWYKKAAIAGNSVAQNNLAIMYQFGYGIPKNLKKAIYWYRKAGLIGNKNAQNSLGLMIVNGLGIEREPVEAMTWFILANLNQDKVVRNANDNKNKLELQLTKLELQQALNKANKIQQNINKYYSRKQINLIKVVQPYQNENRLIAVQRYLRALGYYQGEVDGILGTSTYNAISKLKTDYGLKINNKIDDVFIQILRRILLDKSQHFVN